MCNPQAKAPTLLPTNVLIQVRACGVSNIDKRVVSGDLSDIKPSTGIIGYEVSGIVGQIGSSVQGYAIGDEVVASIPLDLGGGYAEFVSVSSDCIGTCIIVFNMFITHKSMHPDREPRKAAVAMTDFLMPPSPSKPNDQAL